MREFRTGRSLRRGLHGPLTPSGQTIASYGLEFRSADGGACPFAKLPEDVDVIVAAYREGGVTSTNWGRKDATIPDELREGTEAIFVVADDQPTADAIVRFSGYAALLQKARQDFPDGRIVFITNGEILPAAPTPERVAVYARVSTHDQQTLPMQLDAMRAYAERKGWQIATTVEEVGAGAKTRPRREELLRAARRREIDVIIVWLLDRWGRSPIDLIATLQELNALKVGFVSLSEALDLTTPSGRAFAGMLAVFAEFERDICATG
jgi:hypothetical protein